jgi:hypothetical protein
MERKRIDVELDLDSLAWYASKAVKGGMSRRQYMSKILKRVAEISEQSPDMPLRYVLTKPE